MRLANKLALAIAAAIAVATIASSAIFLKIEYSLLKRSESKNNTAMIASVTEIIHEAQLAGDPLILVDYLRMLGREHTEIGRCRIFLGKHWQNVKGVGGKLDKDNAIILTALTPEKTKANTLVTPAIRKPGSSLHAGLDSGFRRNDADQLQSLGAQIWLSRSVIEATQLKARQALFQQMAQTCGIFIILGLLIAFPLGHGLSRRIHVIEVAVAKIGEGNQKVRLKYLGGDEIGRLSQNINRMAEKLEEMDKMKKDFVASITHELRSPLGAIESYVSRILADGTLNEENRQGLSRILNNVNRLSHFVSNLLQMAKIERGKLDFAPKAASLPSIIEDGALFFTALARQAGIYLECKVDREIGPMILDSDLISHVLANLISNALKFTRSGGSIFVTLERAGAWAECGVRDTGIGLEEKDVKRIFTPFERIKNPLKATGVGLGLAISKSIIEMHHGEIGVTSKIGAGSRFYFRLPISRSGVETAP